MIRTQSRTASLYSQDDPLSLALKPPSFESDEERERRVKAELEAQLISDRIDEELRQERELKRRQNTPVKVCLSPFALALFLLFYTVRSVHRTAASPHPLFVSV